jgi:glycosyltransferase involved in cell wall biosynthesis
MMRIAIVSSYRRRVGGVESYVEEVATELASCGSELAHFCEYDVPTDRPNIRWPAHTVEWCIAKMGAAPAIAAMREWHPDVIYSQGLESPKTEVALLSVAPAIFYAHVYHGTCVSGTKTHKFPDIVPCTRAFGWKCLLHYYPRRCGGLSPLTALREYWNQAERFAVLQRYRAIVTSSAHMRNEYLRNGFDPSKVFTSSYLPGTDLARADVFIEHAAVPPSPPIDKSRFPARLLFIGRMEPLKGGAILLDALPMVAAALDKPVELVLCGDGLYRILWESRANVISSQDTRIKVVFEGWLNGERIAELQRSSDLLVVPSLWPEPFGKVGPESGLKGLPAAAFAVGGIPEWLYPGINGYLAPANPPTARGLADAIVKCLEDPAEHQRLRAGALAVAQRFDLHRHVSQLSELFQRIAESSVAIQGGETEWNSA